VGEGAADAAAVLGDHRDLGPVALTIGVLDGVHRGHAELVQTAARVAAEVGGRATAMTIDPHPRCVLDPAACPPALTAMAARTDLLRAAGAAAVLVLPFSRAVSEWSAEDFSTSLTRILDLRALVIGPDFALGHDRRGNAAFLEEFGRDHGFTVTVAEPLIHRGERISSTRVRAALQGGDMELVVELLGHPHIVDGVVVHGEGVGRRLGFPTANLDVGSNRCLPAVGVYAGWAWARGAWYPAAGSIGHRPTFGSHGLSVEWHLLDFDEDIYDETIRIAMTHRLRDEVAYAGEAALIEQIALDVVACRRLLEGQRQPAALAPGAGGPTTS
jgi:riboflavin kinase/FMN adenylyltransferase